MSGKIGNAQSRATFFRHSAVLSLPAVLLRKLPNVRSKTTTSRYNIKRLVPSSHQNQARSPAFHSIRSSAFHRISHRSHAFHRVSHQPGWLTSCNTGLKVISVHRNSSANRASPAHIIRRIAVDPPQSRSAPHYPKSIRPTAESIRPK